MSQSSTIAAVKCISNDLYSLASQGIVGSVRIRNEQTTPSPFASVRRKSLASQEIVDDKFVFLLFALIESALASQGIVVKTRTKDSHLEELVLARRESKLRKAVNNAITIPNMASARSNSA